MNVGVGHNGIFKTTLTKHSQEGLDEVGVFRRHVTRVKEGLRHNPYGIANSLPRQCAPDDEAGEQAVGDRSFFVDHRRLQSLQHIG